MSLDEFSDRYIEDTYAYDRANPRIIKNMLVEVFNYEKIDRPYYCGIARVLEMTCDSHYNEWLLDVEMKWKGELKKYLVFSHCCEIYKGRELRLVK